MPTITPIDKPVSNLGPSADSNAIQTAKQKAIAAFMGGNPQQNQQAIAPEEVSAANSGEKTEVEQELSTEQAPNAETTEESSSEKKEPPLSAQYAVLARKEKALRAKEVAFQQAQRTKEAEWAAKEESLKTNAFDPSKYVPIEDLKRNAYRTLLDKGAIQSFDDLSQQALQEQSPEFQSIRQMREEMRQELQALKSEQEQIRKSSESQQAQAYQQAVRQIEIEAKQLVFTDPEFDTIKNTGSVKQVVRLIEKTFQESGELLSVDAAARLVEEELVEQGAQYALLNKIQARLKKAAKTNEEKQQAASPKQPQQGNQLKTLTNAVTNTRPLSARERALLAFKGEKF